MSEASSPSDGLRQISSADEGLLRQISPSFIVNDGRLSRSLAFRPGTDDNGACSIDRETVVTPSQSFEQYNELPGHKSVGVIRVMVEDVVQVFELHLGPQLTTRVWDDSSVPGVRESHGYIDFNGVGSPKVCERLSAMLVAKAKRFGWAYQPGDDPPAKWL